MLYEFYKFGWWFIKKLFLIALFLFPSLAFADSYGVGIRAGLSVPTQDFDTATVSTTASVGPVLGGEFFYRFKKGFEPGLALEWESHGINFNNIGLGKFRIIRLFPFFNYHFLPESKISPYFGIGVGANINIFSEATAYFGTVTLEPEHTIAMKVAGGAELKVSKRFAINFEASWKINQGDFTVLGSGLQLPGDFNANAFNFAVGGRFFF